MLKIRHSLLIVFTLICLTSHSQVPLRVMTFNIRYDNPSDSIFNWDHRKAMVLDVFRNHKPDIAGLQEVLYSQLQFMKDSLKEYSWFGVGRDDGGKKGEFVPICWNSSRFVKVDGAYFWLSKTPEVPGSRSWKSGCSRIVTWVMLRDRQTMALFFVFNTHFDNASEEARTESARLLRKRIDETCSIRPVILTGDFNCDSSSMAYKILTDQRYAGFFTDCRSTTAGDDQHPNYSYVGFPFSPKQGDLIDFVFKRNARPFMDSGYRIVTDNREGRYPSDHLPVIADFNIRASK
jgi:endonuclease/exonuclease/phosphatase family metal-dependent hydrolase